MRFGMPRLAVIAALSLLTACATGAPQADAPDKISITNASWGVLRGEWTIERRGMGHYEPHEGTSGSFTVTPRQFSRVQSLLHPIERFVGQNLPCNPGPTDGPYGAITWTRHGADTVIAWTTGCVSPERSEILHSMEAADEAVRAMAGAP